MPYSRKYWSLKPSRSQQLRAFHCRRIICICCCFCCFSKASCSYLSFRHCSSNFRTSSSYYIDNEGNAFWMSWARDLRSAPNFILSAEAMEFSLATKGFRDS